MDSLCENLCPDTDAPDPLADLAPEFRADSSTGDARLPRGNSALPTGNFRGFLDPHTARELAHSAASGAALAQLAPHTAAAPRRSPWLAFGLFAAAVYIISS